MCVAEPIVDLDGGGNAWEEGRIQPIEEKVCIRQHWESKRESGPRVKYKFEVTPYS